MNQDSRPDSRIAPGRLADRASLDVVATLFLVVLSTLFYSSVLRLWWTHDDAFHLHYILAHSPLAYTTQPSVWRELPFRMLTPLLFLSLHLDLSLFGLSPRGFYAHQLVVLAMAAGGFFCLLRLWLSRFFALVGGVLLLLGVPVTATVGALMDRHYLEGLCLSLGCAAAFVWSLRSGRNWLAICSALLYVLASLEKEIFVPLIVVLLVIPEGGKNERARLALPHLVGLGAYIAYRVFMLGVLFGGYGWALTPRLVLRLGAQLPGKMLADLADARPIGWWALGLLGIGVAALVLLRRGVLPAVLVTAVSATLPVLPVSTHLQVRYALLSWLVVVILFLFGCHALAHEAWSWSRPVAGGLALAACAVAAISAREAWVKNYDDAARMSEENRFFLRMPPGSLLRQPLGPGASFSEFRWLREDYLKLPAGVRWSYDDFNLCLPQPPSGLRVWGFDPSKRQVEELTGRLALICSEYRSHLRWNAPLTAVFNWRAGAVYWSLGPFAEGAYSLIIADGAGVLDVPRDYGYQTGGAQSLTLRVRYVSPEGWITYSPDIHLDRTARPHAAWRRPLPGQGF